MSREPPDSTDRNSMLDLPLRPGSEDDRIPEGPDRRGSAAAPPRLPQRVDRRRRRDAGLRRLGVVGIVLVVVGLAAFLVLRPSPPEAAFLPNPLDLGRIRVATAGEPVTLTVTNVGERPMPVTGVTLAGAEATDFQIVEDQCSALLLEPQATCAVLVRFVPSELGSRQATLELHADMPASPATVVLAGTGSAPRLSRTPGGLEFASQEVGTVSESLKVTLSNTGTAPLEIHTVGIVGSGAGDFRLTSNRCSKSTLTPGEDCGLRVAFVPRAAGQRTAQLSVSSDTVEPMPEVRFTGEGIWTGTAISVEPDSIDFGRHLVGARRLRRSVQVTNRQSATLRGLEVTVADSRRGFSKDEDGCSKRALAPGESCRVEIGFAAAAEGEFGSVLQIRHAELGVSGVELSARGVAPRWVVEPGAIELADTRVGSRGEPVELRLENRGSAEARVTGVEVAGSDAAAFSRSSDSCSGRELPPGRGCAVSVQFRPEREGLHRGELRVRTSAGAAPEAVALTARAVAPRLRLDREALDFGQVHRTTIGRAVLALSNAGTAPLALGVPSLRGSGAEEFRLLGGSCALGVVLLPGESCSLEIGFQPSLEGRHTARLQLDHDGLSGPRELPLAGVGLPPPLPELLLSIDEVDFGPQAVGERSSIFTVTVRSGGTGRLEFRGFALEGAHASDFQIVPATCHDVPFLVPGSECALGIRFMPSAAGGRQARLIIRHNAGTGVSSVDLLGEGLGGPSP